MLRQAVILVGGLGSRLGGLTKDMPKPALPIGGRPFLEQWIEELVRFDLFEEILLLAGHKADVIAELFEGRRFGRASVSVVVEDEPLGTAGALVNAAGRLDDRFVLMNGDTYFDFNLVDFVARPLADGELARVALVLDCPGNRYGRVVTEAGRVLEFLPSGGDASLPVDTGIYLLDKAILQDVGSLPASMGSRVFVPLARRGGLHCRTYTGRFIDIGVPEDFALADDRLNTWRTRPAVFFDRDGVLNEDVGYAHRPDQITWVAGAREAIRACNDAGALVFVVTNQSGVARGYYGEADVAILHRWMQDELAKVGAHVDAFAHCPHHPDGTVAEFARACDCRKPEPGMIRSLLARWPVDVATSILVGDKETDIEAARRAGIAGLLFAGGDLRDFLATVTSRIAQARSNDEPNVASTDARV